MELNIIKNKVKESLNELYTNDKFLIHKKLCERCLSHRFAVYLEKQNFIGYYIDCEYNKSHLNNSSDIKIVSNPNGNYIDVIITKRNGDGNSDLIAFEVKRGSNYNGRNKDRENLKILTNQNNYFYKYGFFIIFGENEKKVKIEIFQNGTLIESYKPFLNNL